MFAKLTAIFAAFTALAILAVASPTPNANDAGDSCSTGPLQCCQQVQSADSLSIVPILAAIGVVLNDINIPVGLGCDPVSHSSANTVCCENNAVGGLLSIGCLPVEL